MPATAAEALKVYKDIDIVSYAFFYPKSGSLDWLAYEDADLKGKRQVYRAHSHVFPHDYQLSCYYSLLATMAYLQRQIIQWRTKPSLSCELDPKYDCVYHRCIIQSGSLDFRLQLLCSLLPT